jgi:hypothetical protein
VRGRRDGDVIKEAEARKYIRQKEITSNGQRRGVGVENFQWLLWRMVDKGIIHNLWK